MPFNRTLYYDMNVLIGWLRREVLANFRKRSHLYTSKIKSECNKIDRQIVKQTVQQNDKIIICLDNHFNNKNIHTLLG
jgi:hypothetical protein